MPILGSIIKNTIELKSKMPVKHLVAHHPYRDQRRTLRKLIRKAQLTRFGIQHDFGKLFLSRNLIQAYRQKVPLHDYESMYQGWWSDALAGEADVCWPGKIRYFALSSGTSGASSKYIPVTSDMLRAIKKTSIRQIFSLAQYDFPTSFYEKGILIIGGCTNLSFNGKYYEGDLSGITARNIPFWFHRFYKPGKKISKVKDWNTKLDEIVKNAPRWDIAIIVGVPAWLQILLQKIIEHYHLKTIHDIWPNLTVFVHGGVAFEPYKNSFRSLLARPIEYIETYLASEGYIAFQTQKSKPVMKLVLNHGIFYEFIPFNDQNFDEEGNLKDHPQCLSIREVVENVEYALIISTCSGAWRYAIGDTIRFVSVEESEIIITGRTRLFLSVCGEHLSLDNINRAVYQAAEQLKIDIIEFAVAAFPTGNRFKHHWYIGSDDAIKPERLGQCIDAHLKKLNDDYAVERLQAIQEIEVSVLPLHVFYDWMRENGKVGGQHKFPRVLKGENLKKWCSFIENLK